MEKQRQLGADEILDLIVVGGGINGAGIAADAAGRGLSVGLYEAADFASATSSASSKLVHGGLRYLELYEFRLVAKALAEREIIMKKAAHITIPMRFILPHQPFLRPTWMIRLGLCLYDNLSKRSTLTASKQVDLTASGLLKKNIKTGFEYSDCWVDDARLVILNVISAQQNGAEVCNYCRVEKAQRLGGVWQVTLYNTITNIYFQRYSRALVNATGPWVKQFFDNALTDKSPRNIRLIKGSHIVTKRLHDQPQAYILQNQDKRVVFIIPYLDDFSIIGTTDIEFSGDPRHVTISEDEITYLLGVVNQYFIRQITKNDIIYSYSGVRPLCDDQSNAAQSVTRDYTLEISAGDNQPPLLAVFGGKLTTYRKLAEAAMHKLAPYFTTNRTPWTAQAPLPGGDFNCTRNQYATHLSRQYPFLEKQLLQRYVNQFGTLTLNLLADVHTKSDRHIFWEWSISP
ncbi:glycerol-3-phosphate dehydrogenase [Psychromonas sp. MME2]|uniref:glycerol-3-phosphate dehydrogenase n=1 Tax=Psychromonas sp. MME2 TaxID=3231033 RepID=UPI00339B9F7D